MNEESSDDVAVGMDIWHCPGCGAIWRNASGAANTALIATGGVLLAPAGAWAAPYVPATFNAVAMWGTTAYYNPATWAAAIDIINVLTPPVNLPTTWPGFVVCVGVSCWDPNPN
jgi:hypothetical protein